MIEILEQAFFNNYSTPCGVKGRSNMLDSAPNVPDNSKYVSRGDNPGFVNFPFFESRCLMWKLVVVVTPDSTNAWLSHHIITTWLHEQQDSDKVDTAPFDQYLNHCEHPGEDGWKLNDGQEDRLHDPQLVEESRLPKCIKPLIGDSQ